MDKQFLIAFFFTGVLFWSQAVLATSDLAITNVYTLPENPSQGQDANAYIVLKNLGDQASHDFNLTLSQMWRGDQNDQNVAFYWLNQTKLFPQQERTYIQTLHFANNGNWELAANFAENRDANGWPQDANWNNNHFTRYMNVGPVQTDPMVSQMAVSRYGPPLHVLIQFNVRNNSPNGLGTSGGKYQITTQKEDYNTTIIAYGEFHPLLPEEEYTINREYTAPQGGLWTFTTTIYPYNVDANLSNNSRAQSIQLDSNIHAPDFRPVYLTIDYKSGGYIRFRMPIKNDGNQDYQGPLFHRYAVYTQSQQLVQESIQNDTNKPFPIGQQYTYYPSFGNLPNGYYDFNAKVDYYNDVNELNENNNDAGPYYFTITDSNYNPLPNIRFSEPLQVVDINGQKNLQIKYVLDGNQSIGSFVSKITGAGQDANSVNYFTTPSMQPGVVLTYYQSLNFSDHNRMIRVDLDYNNSIQESNENDNTAIIFVDLNQSTLKPNLFIERIMVLYLKKPWSPQPDANSAWVFVVVKNNGEATAGASTLRLDANVVKDFNVVQWPPRYLPTPALQPSQKASLHTRYDKVNGKLYLLATADYYDVVDESNENDNQKSYP